MKLIEWQKNKALVGWWREIIDSENGQLLQAVMDDGHTRHTQVLEPDAAAVHLGRIYGYDQAINNLFVGAATLQEELQTLGQPTFSSQD